MLTLCTATPALKQVREKTALSTFLSLRIYSNFILTNLHLSVMSIYLSIIEVIWLFEVEWRRIYCQTLTGCLSCSTEIDSLNSMYAPHSLLTYINAIICFFIAFLNFFFHVAFRLQAFGNARLHKNKSTGKSILKHSELMIANLLT